jgi:hypothetical protein
MLSRLVVVALLLAELAPAAERVFDWSAAKTNQPPPGFRVALGGAGAPADWRVLLEDVPSLMPAFTPNAPAANRRPVLAQLSRDPEDERFPLCIFEEDTFGDFTLTTRFKLVDGKTEQMAGIAFRLQDERNYYYVRASGLGGTFSFFKIVEGVRSPPIGAKVEIPRGVWHEMTIECKGTQLRFLLNGQEVIPPLGDKTFSSGKIAFWTKSDSVSHFTETRILYKPKEILAQTLLREALQKYPRLVGLKIFAGDGTNANAVRVVASKDAADLGKPGDDVERDVIARNRIYHGKGLENVVVTMPLHDGNGDAVAAVQVTMRGFPGQTEKNAISRAMPVVQLMEARVQTAQDLLQ